MDRSIEALAECRLKTARHHAVVVLMLHRLARLNLIDPPLIARDRLSRILPCPGQAALRPQAGVLPPPSCRRAALARAVAAAGSACALVGSGADRHRHFPLRRLSRNPEAVLAWIGARHGACRGMWFVADCLVAQRCRAGGQRWRCASVGSTNRASARPSA